MLPLAGLRHGGARRAGGGGEAIAHLAAASRADFIFIADRWRPTTREFGRYVWLPLRVSPNGAMVSVGAPRDWRYQ